MTSTVDSTPRSADIGELRREIAFLWREVDRLKAEIREMKAKGGAPSAPPTRVYLEDGAKS